MTIRALLTFALLVRLSPLAAGDLVGWRSWVAADGMPESYSQSLGADPDGRVWVRHGAVGFMSLLDGYSLLPIPEPRDGFKVNFDLLARVYGNGKGEAWTVENAALKHYVGGRWAVEARQQPGETMLGAIPIPGNLVLVLFVDRVSLFHQASHSWTVIKRAADSAVGPFRKAVRGFGTEIWLAGENGAARLYGLDGATPDGAQTLRWTERETRQDGLRNLDRPTPDGNGGLFFTAATSQAGVRKLARWSASGVEVLYTGGSGLLGWPGADGSIWIHDNGSLFSICSGRQPAVDRRGVLAGSLVDYVTQPGGAFWVTTTEGVMRYSPPLWRTPPAVASLGQPVLSMVEDQAGRMWFTAASSLIELDGTDWHVYPLPPEHRIQNAQVHNLTALPDGRIAFKTLVSENTGVLMTFDPRSRRFSVVELPRGQQIDYTARRQDGTLWLQTINPCGLEIFDGHSFQQRLGREIEPVCGQLRTIIEQADGSIWMGTAGHGALVWRNGRLEQVAAAQGYPELAVFAMYERAPGRVFIAGRSVFGEFDGKRWSQWGEGLDRARYITTAHDGTYWIASASGVHRIQNGEWITNGEEDGLPSDIVNCVYQDSRGRLWAGTMRGLSQYHPEADTDPPRSVVMAGNPREAASEGNIKFQFAGVDKWKQTASERLLYSYRLDGGAWSPFTQVNSAAFQKLKSGAHRIEVRAMDRSGNAGAPSPPFDFAVAFAWYRQTGFLLSAAISLAVISLLLRLAVTQFRQLKHSKIAAEGASRSKSEFLANMSHEIRTPMNAIMGMTELALQKPSDAEQEDFLRTAYKSAQALLGILNDILDLSKVEAGKLDLAEADFELRECLEDSLRTLRLWAGEKGLTLRCHVGTDLPAFLTGDERRLRQVILNLAGNAIKFTQVGTVAIDVSRDADETALLRFRVADTGIGIPLEKQRLVFAPFEQADNSITRLYGGTGLGLAISSQLVGLMGGTIRAESPWLDAATGQLVQGTAFHFAVRFREGQRPQAKPAADPAASRPLRVLLAEDNLVNQKLACRLLEKLGHQVTVAGDGTEVLQALERAEVDVVLMDMQMPVMDGLQATRSIRLGEREHGGHLPIVALTANALSGDRERCLAAGMDAYLAKPIQKDELARVLQEAARPPAGVAC
jgi:signal transduction histidine kinase/CheY-like chemotaxis protein/streptogramin lyase